MNVTIFKKSIAASIAALALGSASASLHAEPLAANLTVTCPATGPGIAACAGIGILLNEFTNLANGKEAFGPNGEVRKIVEAPISIISGNLRAADRESGEINKLVRGVFGISMKDIAADGIWGGPNSVFRKPFG